MTAITPADLIARPWLKAYPAGVPADVDTSQYQSLVALMEEAFKKNASKVAYSFMGKDMTFAETDSLSLAFGAYLQTLGLAKGDRRHHDAERAAVPHCGGGHFACGLGGGQCQPALHTA